MAGQVDNEKYPAIKWKIMNNKTHEITIDLNQKQNLLAFIVGFVGKQTKTTTTVTTTKETKENKHRMY